MLHEPCEWSSKFSGGHLEGRGRQFRLPPCDHLLLGIPVSSLPLHLNRETSKSTISYFR
jgi:hypothetical protein